MPTYSRPQIISQMLIAIPSKRKRDRDRNSRLFYVLKQQSQKPSNFYEKRDFIS